MLSNHDTTYHLSEMMRNDSSDEEGWEDAGTRRRSTAVSFLSLS